MLDDSVLELFKTMRFLEEKKSPILEKIKKLESEINKCKKELKSDEFLEIEGVIESEARNIIEQSGKKKIVTDEGTIQKRKSSSIVWEGEIDTLPDDFISIKKSPDKKALKKAIENGEEIQGARIETKESISFSLVK